MSEFAELNELPLHDIDWDEDIRQQEAELFIENHDNLCVDDIPENDEVIVEDVDFDMVLLTLEGGQLPLFPEHFSTQEFLNFIMKDSDTGITSVLQTKEMELCQSLSLNPQFLAFLKIQWYNITCNFKLKDNGKYERKELTDFCSELFERTISNELLVDFSNLISIPLENLSSEHYTVCTDILFGLGSSFLQALFMNTTDEVCAPFVNVKDISPDKLGKVRYVMGWCVRKLVEHSRKYLSDNILSKTDSVRKQIKLHIGKIKILESMIASHKSLQNNSLYKESLEITDRKQNRSQGLLNVSDMFFMFGISLEEKRVNLLNQNRLKKLKGELVSVSLDSVLSDKSISEEWQSLCSLAKQSLTVNDDIFQECVGQLHEQVIKKYFKMGTAEYLRDIRRDLKWTKSEAHRKKVLMRAEKKEQKSDQVKIDEIRTDTSINKVDSHIRIKAMLQKHPNIFESRIYTLKDLELLLKAYGMGKKSGKKSILANRLVDAVNSKDCMIDETVFT